MNSYRSYLGKFGALAGLVGAMVAASAATAQGQTLLGGRVGSYLADKDAFLGGEVLVGLDDHLFFNPNIEVVFPSRANKATFNFDIHYDFARRGSAFFWVGGGLAIIYVDPDGSPSSRTDAGANILLGIGFRTHGRWIPYIQAKVLAADDSDFVLGFGVRF